MNVLHLTDLHVGIASQQWLWPTTKKSVFDDLKIQIEKLEGLDIVIFSGDLTQQATDEEYKKLNQILDELWEFFNQQQTSPQFFPIPGNHDLTRPEALNSTALMMREWFENQDIQKAFWKKDPPEYRKLIDAAFTPYTNWLNTIKKGPIPIAQISEGILPGDASAEIKINNQSLGIIGLNTAWLQISDGDYQKKLHVDTQQLMALTNNDPDGWCKKHDFNLLVTHHPQEWLHPSSLSSWRSEIHTTSRFDAHVFGHMHEASIVSTSEGGSLPRRFIQGSSLFGLEKYGNEIKRSHGYSAFRLSKLDTGKKQLEQWSRLAYKTQSATWKIITNPESDCDDTGCIKYYYDLDIANDSQKIIANSSKVSLNPASGQSSIRSLRQNLSKMIAFEKVRGTEKEIGFNSLANSRSLWLVSDWGLGDDQFIQALQSKQQVEQAYIYKLDCQNFFSRNDIYEGVQNQLGFSFEQMCAQISAEGSCILVLDDVPIMEGSDKSVQKLQNDIQGLAEILLEFCQNIRLIIKSRCMPEKCPMTVIQLRPFDEADTMAYVIDHEHGGRELATTKFIGQLLRHTDGIPTRIDSALRDVEIVGASQLHKLDSDVAGKSAALPSAPSGLIRTLDELQTSDNPASVRAFNLLKVLTMFPRGEQLENVKRFHTEQPFYPQDARILMDAALVDAVEIPSIEVQTNGVAKALLVRRVVREYLYAKLPTQEVEKLNKHALELYFGNNWSIKGIKSHKHMRFDEPHCGAWQIGNASMLVLRATRESVEGKNVSNWNLTRDLASSYSTKLTSGKHFLAVASLCEDLIPLFETLEPVPDISILRVNFTKALRMNGQLDRAIALCKESLSKIKSKSLLQSTHLTLAMCYESQKCKVDAEISANECTKIDPKSNYALQSQAISLGFQKNTNERKKKLQLLEKKARNKKAFVTANNISYSFLLECKDPSELKILITNLYKRASSDRDHHNSMRSIITLAKLHLDLNEPIPTYMLEGLIESYHYLYLENIDTLFNKCHSVLWEVFNNKNEVENLLRLFRYSSLHWRVRGMESVEYKYLGNLSHTLKNQKNNELQHINKEIAYYFARTAQSIT